MSNQNYCKSTKMKKCTKVMKLEINYMQNLVQGFDLVQLDDVVRLLYRRILYCCCAPIPGCGSYWSSGRVT